MPPGEARVRPRSPSSRPATRNRRLATLSPLKIKIFLKFWNSNWLLAGSLWPLAKAQHWCLFWSVSLLVWLSGVAKLSSVVCRMWLVASYEISTTCALCKFYFRSKWLGCFRTPWVYFILCRNKNRWQNISVTLTHAHSLHGRKPKYQPTFCEILNLKSS